MNPLKRTCFFSDNSLEKKRKADPFSFDNYFIECGGYCIASVQDFTSTFVHSRNPDMLTPTQTLIQALWDHSHIEDISLHILEQIDQKRKVNLNTTCLNTLTDAIISAVKTREKRKKCLLILSKFQSEQTPPSYLNKLIQGTDPAGRKELFLEFMIQAFPVGSKENSEEAFDCLVKVADGFSIEECTYLYQRTVKVPFFEALLYYSLLQRTTPSVNLRTGAFSPLFKAKKGKCISLLLKKTSFLEDNMPLIKSAFRSAPTTFLNELVEKLTTTTSRAKTISLFKFLPMEKISLKNRREAFQKLLQIDSAYFSIFYFILITDFEKERDLFSLKDIHPKKMKLSNDDLTRLPAEVRETIFNFLPLNEVIRLSQVSRSFELYSRAYTKEELNGHISRLKNLLPESVHSKVDDIFAVTALKSFEKVSLLLDYLQFKEK